MNWAATSDVDGAGVSQQRRQKMLPRRAAKKGKAKTKVLFNQMDHQQGHSEEECSRASGRVAESDENEDKTIHFTSSHESSSSKVASVKPPGPAYHPVLGPGPPSLPKGIISIALGTAPPVQTAHRWWVNHEQLLTPSASPSKKSKYSVGPQIPTQVSTPALCLEQAGEETEAGSDLVFDNLVHPPEEAWTGPESARSFVVFFNPNGSSSSQMSQPKAMFELPPSSIPPPSFMFNHFAKMVDAIPDED
ncbi:hypothetical protein PLEOSDRAFT_1110754 [Pleurotus ostreatus PC15]|uniref:Uncharacterized protein n=1 Tax=Pleurotus ostreatus (strain PC15) TaxID=1137138 RepID=A0A067PBT9_PLEO1|nr:hypothetical protein PLEOSDRAFT_1110754 [Pleurotus ostreatus PC15]